MGRYTFGAQRVLRDVDRLLETGARRVEPPWRTAIETFPPTERLTRPALQAGRGGRRKKASKTFQPVRIHYPEDKLRRTFFADHPWELARPRTIVEDDGKDYQRQNWSALQAEEPSQDEGVEVGTLPGRRVNRPLNGESVVQRQRWLMERERLSEAEAYDTARKEFYEVREQQEITQRIAIEEAGYYGADLGPSALEIGMKLEDETFAKWKEWAAAEAVAIKQVEASAYTGTDTVDDGDTNGTLGLQEGDESDLPGHGSDDGTASDPLQIALASVGHKR